MKKAIAISCALMTGCASITPPPDRHYWDEAPAHTQCTTDTSGVNAQYAGSLLVSVLGGISIGASIAAGVYPIIGMPLAGIGIAGASDVGNKYDEIEDCEEFKQYVLHRKPKKQNTTNNKTVEAKLNDLKDMLNRSIITEQEYKTARQNIIGKM